MRIIKNAAIVEDQWRIVPEETVPPDLPEGDIIVPLALWRAARDQLIDRPGKLGILLDADEHPQEIAEELAHFDLIALNFPVFRDGRAFSYARLLRLQYGYQGELRAVGDVLRDQLFFMKRCGFDSFMLKPGRSLEDALKAFDEFSVTYQPAADEALSLYRRR